jgi:hypothetical protein
LDAEATIEASRSFVEFIESKSSNHEEEDFYLPEYMAIPQGNSVQNWYWCAVQLKDDYPHLGIPRNLIPLAGGDLEARVKAAEFLHSGFYPDSIHAFGMANGSLKELGLLRDQGIVGSIDSSAPVWRGTCGFDIEDEGWSTYGTPINFYSFEVGEVHSIILRNLEKCHVL